MSTAATPAKRPRDPRLDFFRGLALLIIVFDHVLMTDWLHIPPFLEITPLFWGLTDAAMIFVFISGQVYGIVYGRLLDTRGFGATMFKTWKRVGQLYLANVGTFVAMWAALHALMLLRVPEAVSYEWIQINEARYGTFGIIAAFAALQFDFYCADILPLYMLVLAAGPFMLVGLRRWPVITVVAGVAVYAAAQVGLDFPTRWLGTADMYFNPFGWQIAFLLGVAVQRLPVRVGTGALVKWAAWALLGGVAVYVWLMPKIFAFGILSQPDWWIPASAWGERHNLHPVRVLYFVVFAYCTWLITPRSARFWAAGPVEWITCTGRHSLLMFCLGVVASLVVVTLKSAYDWAWPGVMTGFVVSMTLMFAVAAIADRRKRSRAVPLVSSASEPSVATAPAAKS